MGAARPGLRRAALPASRFFSKKARLRKTEGNRQAPPPPSPPNAPPCKKNARPVCRTWGRDDGRPESSLTDGAPAYAIAPSLPGLRAGLRPSCTLHRSRALSACSAQHKGLRRGRAVSRTLRRTASRLCSMGAAGEHRAALPASRFPPQKKNGRKKGRTGRLRPPHLPKTPRPAKKNARPVCRSAHHHYPAEKPGAIRTYCLPARRPADSSP